MSTNVIVISDDVEKSKIIGDLFVEALASAGFTEIDATFPEYRSIEGVNDHKSALDVIQDTYPNFLNEKVTVRAIKVEGMDVNGYDEDDEEAAFVKNESAQRSKFGDQFHTTVSLFEDRPSKKSMAENRAKAATERRAKMHAIVDNEKVTE